MRWRPALATEVAHGVPPKLRPPMGVGTGRPTKLRQSRILGYLCLARALLEGGDATRGRGC